MTTVPDWITAVLAILRAALPEHIILVTAILDNPVEHANYHQYVVLKSTDWGDTKYVGDLLTIDCQIKWFGPHNKCIVDLADPGCFTKIINCISEKPNAY